MKYETLLIVEDNHVLRDGIKDILTVEGYSVMTSPNGADALKQMQFECPDMILSDIAMPEMDGYEFFDKVRSRPDWLTIPFVFITARGDKEDVLNGKNLGADDYLVKPLTREELLTAVRSRLSRSKELSVVQLKQAYETSLTVLANAIDVRDPYTRGHVERVTAYSEVMGVELGLNDKQLEQIRFGAILHDIGKIMIQETILFKKGPLTDEEWVEVKKHPVIGAEMIKYVSYLAPAIPIVRHHHERWDGNGYPDGLAGAAIPQAARIVAVADGFDAMTTKRPYQDTRSLWHAYEEVRACSGSQYDPQVVDAFQRAWDKHNVQPIPEKWRNGNGRNGNGRNGSQNRLR
jgi:putative two-component system response regulator